MKHSNFRNASVTCPSFKHTSSCEFEGNRMTRQRSQPHDSPPYCATTKWSSALSSLCRQLCITRLITSHLPPYCLSATIAILNNPCTLGNALAGIPPQATGLQRLLQENMLKTEVMESCTAKLSRVACARQGAFGDCMHVPFTPSEW
jgi:hypothetical protein